jgi:hypothetical protein
MAARLADLPGGAESGIHPGTSVAHNLVLPPLIWPSVSPSWSVSRWFQFRKWLVAAESRKVDGYHAKN